MKNNPTKVEKKEVFGKFERMRYLSWLKCDVKQHEFDIRKLFLFSKLDLLWLILLTIGMVYLYVK